MELHVTQATLEDAEALSGLFLRYIRELENYEMEYTLMESTLLSTIQSRIKSRMTLAAVAKEG